MPDPAFPFLGVHFTRMIDGGVECGPNAVLAFAREGYGKTTLNLRDLAESLTYPGFLRLAAKYWRMGAGEMWRSVSKRAFVRALQRLVPEIQRRAPDPRPSGRPRPGPGPRRLDGRRLSHRGARPRRQRAERPLARGNLVPKHRPVDRRPPVIADKSAVCRSQLLAAG